MIRRPLTNTAVLVYRGSHAQLLHQRIRRLAHGLHQQLRTIQIILRVRPRRGYALYRNRLRYLHHRKHRRLIHGRSLY